MQQETKRQMRWWLRLGLWFRNNRLLIIIALAVTAFALGYVGFDQYHGEQKEAHSIAYTIYRTLGLFGLEAGLVESPLPWQLQVGRFMAPAVAAYAVILALMATFYQQVQYLLLRVTRNHVVICGLGKRGLYLARGFQQEGHRVAIIERDPGNDNLRSCRDHGMITLTGDATDPWLLVKAGIHHARHLICVTGTDGANSEVAVRSQEIVGDKHGGPLTCFVHVSDIGLCRLLREKEMIERRTGSFDLEFFNVFETGARVLLNRFPPFLIDGGDDRGHVLVVGLGQMGESLVMRAVRDWRDIHEDDGKRLRICIIDADADTFIQALKVRFPQIQRYCDFAPRCFNIGICEIEQGDPVLDLDAGDLTSIYVCLDDDSRGLSTTILLHRWLRERGMSTPIIVRMTEGSGLARLLAHGPSDKDQFENVDAFCLLDETCAPNLILGGINEIVARAIHWEYVRREEYRVRRAIAAGEIPEPNPSAVPWDHLSEDLKGSNRAQARHISQRLKEFGYTIVCLSDWDAEFYEFAPDEIEAMAKREHDRWLKEKRAAGYIYAEGPKDPKKKTHPDMLEWDALTEEARDKDRNTVRETPRFLARAGFQIVRIGGGRRTEPGSG